ncbi:MAG: DsbA family protein [Nitrospiraceae bacterium]|nr:DsbA family protein [Nitrospiraceae bacterium]MDA8262034.1 DsbA family protein [Actinomycetota bacterium]
MTISKFSINFDYRCPFARNLNEHVVAALEEGAGYDVEFLPFNLSQVHVEEGEPAIWDDPDRAGDRLANEVGYIVSQQFPDKFLKVHLDLFAIRHDRGASLRDRTEIAKVLSNHGIDAEAVLSQVDEGIYSKRLREIHEDQVERLAVFGVPTVFDGERAAFVRVMKRPADSSEKPQDVVGRMLEQVFGHPEFNEVKHTRLDR